MSLKRWLDEGRLKPHRTSKEEITNLLRIVDRDLRDASLSELSSDRRFATAYNAILQLAAIPLYCAGFRSKGTGHHHIVIQSLLYTIGNEMKELVDYFDSCRVKRNIADYNIAHSISESEAQEVLEEATKFRELILAFLQKDYPEYVE